MEIKNVFLVLALLLVAACGPNNKAYSISNSRADESSPDPNEPPIQSNTWPFCSESLQMGLMARGTTTLNPPGGGVDLNTCLEFCASTNADACNYAAYQEDVFLGYCEAVSGNIWYQQNYSPWSSIQPQVTPCNGNLNAG